MISGTRVPVRALAERVKGGETIDDLIEDHPTFPARHLRRLCSTRRHILVGVSSYGDAQSPREPAVAGVAGRGLAASAGLMAETARGVTFHLCSRIASLMWAVRAMTFLNSA